MIAVKFIIVRYRDILCGIGPEVWGFAEDEEREAKAFYENAQAQWSDCYFCEVKISDELKRLGYPNQWHSMMSSKDLEEFEEKKQEVEDRIRQGARRTSGKIV